MIYVTFPKITLFATNQELKYITSRNINILETDYTCDTALT